LEKEPKKDNTFKVGDFQNIYFALLAIFLLTGFIYNYVFFRFFDIDVEQFFTIQDYLASSIEKLYLIIVAIPFAIISSYIAKYFVTKRHDNLHRRILTYVITISPVITMIIAIVMIYNFNNPIGYYLLSFAIFTGCDYLLYKIIFKGDHGSYTIYFYLNTFIFYLLIIISTAVIERDSALNEPLHSLQKYRVHFTREFNINQNTCVVLAATDLYFLFYDKQLDKVYVIPKDGISYIETTR
jgi:hypothetical protein